MFRPMAFIMAAGLAVFQLVAFSWPVEGHFGAKDELKRENANLKDELTERLEQIRTAKREDNDACLSAAEEPACTGNRCFYNYRTTEFSGIDKVDIMVFFQPNSLRLRVAKGKKRLSTQFIEYQASGNDHITSKVFDAGKKSYLVTIELADEKLGKVCIQESASKSLHPRKSQ